MSTPARPAISVVVPLLAGGRSEARAMLATLEATNLAAGDEVVVADATQERVAAGLAGSNRRVVEALANPSEGYVWNVGAEDAANDWLLFVGPDCAPAAGLLDAYFARWVGDRCAARVGRVVPTRAGPLSFALRGALREELTANLLLRREAWRSVGGFLEGLLSGTGIDFRRRLLDAGWEVESETGAVVRRAGRARALRLVADLVRQGAGDAWLGRRHGGGAEPRPRATFALDAVAAAAHGLGRLRSNTAARGAAGDADIVIVREVFPELSETFVVEEARALERLGHGVRFEAITRPARPALGGMRGLRVSYREDDSALARLGCLAWALARHPLRSARDLSAARRWRANGEPVSHLASIAIPARRLARGGERHLHAHFVRVGALDALRISLLTGVPYSVTAHGSHDIWSDPPNFAEKLRRAAFVSTGCAYNVRHLRNVVGPRDANRIHQIIMGVDSSVFSRAGPVLDGRVVVAVGRLIEPKGFADLIDAVALLERSEPVERLMLIGDGPLREPLAERAAERGVAHRVDFLGARESDEVRKLVESAHLLAMPCVVAADGKRDSMPVVVKEAMALELMVVGTREVGLPELIDEEWGRLAPPGDPGALARAIEELLALPIEARAAMGAAGRAFVIEKCGVEREAAKLAALMGLGEIRARSDHQPAVPGRGAQHGPHFDQVANDQVGGE